MALAAIFALAFGAEAALAIQDGVASAAIGYISSTWSEGPLTLELHRISLGQAAYTSPTLVNSYDYGPVYVVVLSALRLGLGRSFDIAAFRYISMTLGLLSALPLAASAAAIARRAGTPPTDIAAAVVGTGVAALLGLAVLSHSITFSRLHPDNLTFTLVATAFAIHFALAARLLPVAFVWALVAVSVTAAFTKQNTVAIAPLLLTGLAGSGAISWRLCACALFATALAVLAGVAAMPADMRAWTVLVPLAHRYEFNAARLFDFWSALTQVTPWVLLTFLAVIPMLVVLQRRNGRRTLWVDASAIAAVSVAAFSAFFKQLGIWNNLALLTAATVPYVGALLGILVTPGGVSRARRALGGLAVVVSIALAWSIANGATYGPQARVDERNLRRMAVLEHQLCHTGRSILVTDMFGEFLSCPSARYALDASREELEIAHPRFNPGPTIFDLPPQAHYLIASETQWMPAAWAPYYRPLNLPIAAPGRNYYRLHLRVYEHT